MKRKMHTVQIMEYEDGSFEVAGVSTWKETPRNVMAFGANKRNSLINLKPGNQRNMERLIKRGKIRA